MAKRSKYTNDNFVPIKNIANGMIILDDNTKVSGIKIVPRNIFILDYITQDNIISNLRNVYDTIDYEFWLISAGRPVDISIYMSALQLQFNNLSNQARRKLIMDDINKGNMFRNNNVVDTEYFIIFRDSKEDVIQKRIRNLITGFANAGISSYQVTNEDLRVLIDNFLNGGQTTTFGTVLNR